MGEVGMHSVSYYILISNIYILFIFFYHYWKNRQWFVRYYIIGKSLQIVGFFMFDFTRNIAILESWYPNGFLIIAGFAFEIFGLVSYDGHYNKKIFHRFMITAGFLFLLLIVSIKFHKMHLIALDAGTFYFFFYGGILLLMKKDKSRFRPIIGYSFLIYSLFRLVTLIIMFSTSSPELHPPNMEMSPGMMPPPDMNKINIGATSQKLMYIVTVISTISYLIILKEQDELAIARINKQISKENKSLKALDEEKNKFFSIVAHDLKGPIGTLASISEMLVDRKNKLHREDYEKWLMIIKESTTRTYIFLNNLLQWARSESNNLTPKPISIDAKEMVNEIITLMETYAQNKQIALVNNCNKNIEIYADKEMTSTVLRNLISNAIKFTDKDGSVTIDAKKGNLTIISVTDTGVGINTEKAKKIFDLDSTHSTEGTQNEKGTGLGLKLCHEFIEKNNGKIWLKSEPGKGSTFYFSLPWKPVG